MNNEKKNLTNVKWKTVYKDNNNEAGHALDHPQKYLLQVLSVKTIPSEIYSSNFEHCAESTKILLLKCLIVSSMEFLRQGTVNFRKNLFLSNQHHDGLQS